ncbi:unnamed protein product, partial [marine sediment metagenome]
ASKNTVFEKGRETEREAFFERVTSAFPGYTNDENVNGADLIEFIGECLKGE